MNDEYERMKKLLQGIGIQFTETGFSAAEISAYACGLRKVREYFYSISEEIFMQGEDLNSLEKYVAMLDIDLNGKDVSRVKEDIISRLSEKFSAFDREKFYSEFESVGSGSVEISGDTLIFSNVEYDDFYRLGRFIRGYIFPFTKMKCTGLGLSWEERDKSGMNFYQLDYLLLPFDVIDTIEGSEIDIEL